MIRTECAARSRACRHLFNKDHDCSVFHFCLNVYHNSLSLLLLVLLIFVLISLLVPLCALLSRKKGAWCMKGDVSGAFDDLVGGRSDYRIVCYIELT